MSIAISVVVKPSRLLRILTFGMSSVLLAIGLLSGLGLIGNLTDAVRATVAISSFFPAFFGFYHIVRNRKVLHIDITSLGQIRLREIDVGISCQTQKRPHVNGLGRMVQLSQDSTIWPQLLLLRFQADTGETVVMPILPDCVSRDGFRALSVACRWIAAHNYSDDHKKS